jgi:hypothetical protein
MTTPGSENRPQGEYELHVVLGVDDQYQVMLNNALKTHLTDAVKTAIVQWNKMMTGIKPDAGDRGTAVQKSLTWVDTDGVPTS